METFFFYGSLMDDDVVRAILSRRLRTLAPRPATLRGYRRVYAAGTMYPAIVPKHSATVDGLLVSGIGRKDRIKLDRFEGVGYAAVPVVVTVDDGGDETGLVYLPKRGLRVTDKEWTLSVWQRRDKPQCRTDWQGVLRPHR